MILAPHINFFFDIRVAFLINSSQMLCEKNSDRNMYESVEQIVLHMIERIKAIKYVNS